MQRVARVCQRRRQLILVVFTVGLRHFHTDGVYHVLYKGVARYSLTDIQPIISEGPTLPFPLAQPPLPSPFHPFSIHFLPTPALPL